MNAGDIQAWMTTTNAGLFAPLCILLLTQQLALSLPCFGCTWVMQRRVTAARSRHPRVKAAVPKRNQRSRFGPPSRTPRVVGWTLTSCPRTPGWWRWGPSSCWYCSSNPQIPLASSCSLSVWWHRWHQRSSLVLQINSEKKRLKDRLTRPVLCAWGLVNF